ncbi:MAG TPA: hypothetical protein VMM57_05010 [Bacteroidota bacterium]|nr:hypothetical protein [Bacteroidota bacterium]
MEKGHRINVIVPAYDRSYCMDRRFQQLVQNESGKGREYFNVHAGWRAGGDCKHREAGRTRAVSK